MNPICRPRHSALALCIAAAFVAHASAQLRVVNYNVAGLNGNQTRLEEVFGYLNDDDKPGFATAPAIYVLQEVENADRTVILTMLNNQAPSGVTYALATYTNSGEDCCAGAQALYYRTDLITEQTGGHDDIYTGAGRDADRWRMRVNGYTGTEGRFYIYSAHLKSSDTTADQNERLSGAQAIRSNADALPADTHIIYAGDWNLYDNAEPAYAEFLSSGNGQATDPLGTGSWAGSGHAIKHTQSPQLDGSLVGGGMDDRFDFQLSTAAFHDDEGLSYMAGTYRAFANDGNHYNQAISNGNNTYYPADIPRSNDVAFSVRGASDHVPVIAEYQIPAMLDADLPGDFGRVIQNAVVTIDLSVSNAAPAIVANGADELDYDATASGDLSGGCSGSVDALAAADVCPITVDTSTVGAVSGSVDVSSTSQGVAGSPVTLNASGEVVRASNASFESGADVTSTTLSQSSPPDSGAVTFNVPMYNRGYDANQALLDLDGVANVNAPFAFVSGLASSIGSSPATLTFEFDTTSLAGGTYTDVITIDVSDEDLPGASASQLTLTLEVNIQTLVGDLDGNCTVDLTDLGMMLGAFGKCFGDAGYLAAADIDPNGCIDLTDLGIMLGQFGQSCP